MTDDATLSDFASTADESGSGDASSADTDADATDAGESEPTATDDTGSPVHERAGETGLSTYAWGEYSCSRCEAETDRVWRADGDLVCPDCKAW